MRNIFKKLKDLLILRLGIQSEIKIQELDPSEPDLPAESFGESDDYEAQISNDSGSTEECECGGNCGCEIIDVMPEPSFQAAIPEENPQIKEASEKKKLESAKKKSIPKKGTKKEPNDSIESAKKKKTTKRRYYKRKDTKKKD